jgi:dynein heavy chain 1, cytosolic
MASLKEERTALDKARQVLDMQTTGTFVKNDERLKAAHEELVELRSVWLEMKSIIEEIDELKEKQWLGVQPKKVRASLDSLLQKLKQLPTKMKSYEAYSNVKSMIEACIKVSCPDSTFGDDLTLFYFIFSV